RWTFATGTQDLGVPVGILVAQSTALNADGSVIVGYAVDQANATHTWIWAPALGMRDFKTYLKTLGTDLSAWSGFPLVTGVSADGLAIVGIGSHSTDHPGEAFIAHIPGPPCYADCDGAAVPRTLDANDFARFL